MNKFLRTLGLWMLILFDVAFVVICWFGGFPWNWVGIAITLLIVGFEIWGVTFGWVQKDGTISHKTISQMYWRWGSGADGKEGKPMWATLGVISFALSMLGLCIHLIAFDRKK